MKKILIIFGTRPEAIKLAPLVNKLKKSKSFDIKVCVTAQHREMLDQVLDIFDIKPDYDLNLMRDNQSLETLSASILTELMSVFDDFHPDLVMVHGDTTTTLFASLSSFYKKIRVAHVEAGLRTGNMFSPWPEEANRKLTANIAELHFAPTMNSSNNLLREGIPSKNITVTGNTVIDALFLALEKIDNDNDCRARLSEQFKFLNPEKKLILITCHRRENFGEGIKNICKSLISLAEKNSSLEFVLPVHLNPNIRKVIDGMLAEKDSIHIISHLDYLPFIYLMHRSYLILTDSGGIQEEAPSLGKPVLVMRDHSERPEAIEAGTVMLVGSDSKRIEKEVEKLVNDDGMYKKMSQAHNPYGDGKASDRIIDAMYKYFGLNGK